MVTSLDQPTADARVDYFGLLPSPLRGALHAIKIAPGDFVKPPTPTMSRWCSNQLSYAPANQAAYST